MSPQKVRLVVNLVRGKPVQEALDMLRFLPHRAARPVAKAIKSAAANAETTYQLDPDALYIARITANAGRMLKRYRPKARGRVGPILSRSTHLEVVVKEKEA
jgi:large subunit ribosomal protein L22